MIQMAVIIGHHAFDAPNFWRMFQAMPDIAVYPQTLSCFSADKGGVRDWYDVVLFYNYHQATPGSQATSVSSRNLAALQRLGETEQGIVVLHHGLVAFPGWGYWSEVCGLSDRQFTNHAGQVVKTEVARAGHPVTHGLTGWEMVDETYAMRPAGPGVDVLLTTDHPLSLPTIAWAKEHGRARVFCYQSGHDQNVYGHPCFRAVLGRGIAWAARQL